MKGVSGGSQEAKAGWFISQDVGPAAAYQPEKESFSVLKAVAMASG